MGISAFAQAALHKTKWKVLEQSLLRLTKKFLTSKFRKGCYEPGGWVWPSSNHGETPRQSRASPAPAQGASPMSSSTRRRNTMQVCFVYSFCCFYVLCKEGHCLPQMHTFYCLIVILLIFRYFPQLHPHLTTLH